MPKIFLDYFKFLIVNIKPPYILDKLQQQKTLNSS